MYKLNVTPDEVKLIGSLLRQVAWELVDPLIRKINSQILEQDAAEAALKSNLNAINSQAPKDQLPEKLEVHVAGTGVESIIGVQIN